MAQDHTRVMEHAANDLDAWKGSGVGRSGS
jgi:hypothetical protein